MKRILLFPPAACLVLLLASFTNTASAQPRTDVSISYQTFYDELDPYGRWMDYPDHGYVWIPEAGPDFQPYQTNGHWVWTDDYEWMWVSDYDWGWAPFHYGRWLHDPYYGWIWVPGYEWSPAWVAWRDGGDYYGWAPLRPGINISINFSLGGYNPPIDYWCFAPRRYITSPRIYDYCAPRRNNITIINQTTIINNYNYNRNVFRTGPGRRDAERYTGRINPVRFRESNNPGRSRVRGNQVSVYRPQVQRDNNRSFTPRNVTRYNNNNRNDRGVVRNGNNLPQRRDNANGDLGRRRSNVGTNPGNGGAERQRDVINRGNNGNNDNRFGNRERTPRQLENPNPRNNAETREARPFERRKRDNGNTTERPPQRREVFERNNNPNRGNNEARPFERRNVERPQTIDRGAQQREMQRNDDGRRVREQRQQQQQQSQPRVQQPQPRQEQPRQFERRSENRSENRGGGNGNGNGRSRRDR